MSTTVSPATSDTPSSVAELEKKIGMNIMKLGEKFAGELADAVGFDIKNPSPSDDDEK